MIPYSRSPLPILHSPILTPPLTVLLHLCNIAGIMSWMCSGASNKELVANLWKHGIIKTPRIREAFEKVDRAHFSPIFPYEDSPQVRPTLSRLCLRAWQGH